MSVQPSKELEQLAQEAHSAWERGDDEWFKAHLSAHDPIMLGSAPEEQMIGADAVTESTTEELANRDQYAFKASAPRIIDARESGDIGWMLTESRWEFEDGGYVPVRGLGACIARTASGSSSPGSQHPRSPTNCFDQDHRSHSQPASRLSLALWAGRRRAARSREATRSGHCSRRNDGAGCNAVSRGQLAQPRRQTGALLGSC